MAKKNNGENASAEEVKNIKNGEIRVTLKEETPIWADRKRKTIFALPWSFTRYVLTPSKLMIETGFFTKTIDEIRLYRIRDVSYTQSLGERMGGTGTLKLISSDASVPQIELRHIKNARQVKDVLSQAIEVSRRENGVRTSEVVGAGGMHATCGQEHDHGHESLGPDLAPDFNHNGIDDRLE